MKQRDKNKESLLRYGVPEDITEILLDNNYTVSKLRTASKTDLSSLFDGDQIKYIKDLIQRTPISDEVFKQLVKDSELMCCFCWNVDEAKPVVVHHIEDYSISQNNDYDNLVVVCLNHHADIHTKREISQQNFPPIKIIQQKERWTQALSDYRSGNRIAPGKEGERKIHIQNSPNSVVSIDQKGGQTARTIINQRAIARTFDDESKTTIQSDLKQYSPVSFNIRLSSGDAESETLARSIADMLKELNWENISFEYNLAGSYPEGLEIAIGPEVEPVFQALANTFNKNLKFDIKANKYNNLQILTFTVGPNPNKYSKVKES